MGDIKCISCLKTGKHKDIFSLKYKDKSLQSIFQMLTAVKLNKDCIALNLNKICHGCTMQLKLFYEFRNKAIKSYDKLFAMKLIPDGSNNTESDTVFKDDDSVIDNNDDDTDFELIKIQHQDDDNLSQQDVEDEEFQDIKEEVPTVSQSLGLMDINNLFKEEIVKWHCEYCDLIFPIEEEEQIQKHKTMEEKKHKNKNKVKIIVKKIVTTKAKAPPKARLQLKRKAKTDVKTEVIKSEIEEQPIKLFRPGATEQIRTSTIVRKLPPGEYPNLISDINDMLKTEDDEDFFGDSKGKNKKRYNYLNTGQTKKRKKGTALEKDSEKYICDVCGKEMSYASTLRVHMTMHTGKKFVCQVCGSGYVTRAGLSQHMNKHEQRKDFTCSYCAKSFYSRTDLLGHIYDKRQAGSHLDESCAPFTRPICEICGKTFYNMKTLKLHVSTHNQTKDYPCPQCDRKFFHEHKLNMHLWTHEVQFRCMKCYNIYKQIELKKHDCSGMGVAYEPLEFECRICGQIFKGPGRYEQHQKTHNLKECKFCKKKFNCSAKLFRCHLNTHNFKCSLCDKGFAKKSSWKYHVENQTCLKGKKEVVYQVTF